MGRSLKYSGFLPNDCGFFVIKILTRVTSIMVCGRALVPRVTNILKQGARRIGTTSAEDLFLTGAEDALSTFSVWIFHARDVKIKFDLSLLNMFS